MGEQLFYCIKIQLETPKMPLNVVFRQRSSFVECCLQLKIVLGQRSSSVKGRLPSKEVKSKNGGHFSIVTWALRSTFVNKFFNPSNFSSAFPLRGKANKSWSPQK